jgi:hypothetical protein
MMILIVTFVSNQAESYVLILYLHVSKLFTTNYAVESQYTSIMNMLSQCILQCVVILSCSLLISLDNTRLIIAILDHSVIEY